MAKGTASGARGSASAEIKKFDLEKGIDRAKLSAWKAVGRESKGRKKSSCAFCSIRLIRIERIVFDFSFVCENPK
jgi:hypothetical protein